MTDQSLTADGTINCAIPQLSPTQMKRVATRYRKSGKAIYLEAEPGVGKSFIANEFAQQFNYHLVDRRASGWLPDTAAGTLMQDVETRSTIWYPPEWLQIKSDKPKLYFFDEFSAAHDMVRKPLFGFFLERKLNDIKIDSEDFLWAAGNMGSFGTVVQHMDNATRGRFMNFQLVASLAQWLPDFAAIHNVHSAVVGYLKLRNDHFCMTEYAQRHDLIAYGNPRNWTSFSDLIWDTLSQTDGKLTKEARQELEWAGSSVVGTALSVGCLAILDQQQQGHTFMDILEASSAKRRQMWPTQPGQFHGLIHSMMSYPKTVREAQRVVELMREFPTDSELQYKDMVTPVREVMLQRLRTFGVSQNDISSNFGDESASSIKAMLDRGEPLVNLRCAA